MLYFDTGWVIGFQRKRVWQLIRKLFAKEYSDRSSFKLRAGDDFSGGSAPSIWFDNQLNYYSLDSTIKMGANMNRIAQIWGGHYDLDLQGYDRSWQESHGNVVRIDCNGKTILDIDPQKRLEPLRHELSGYWSRRINNEHRLIYSIDEKNIYIISCLGHY